MSVWVRAARPTTLTAAVAPILVGSAVPAANGFFHLGVLVAALAGAVLIQVGANYANDLFDFLRGADPPDRLGPPRATATGAATPRQMVTATGVVVVASVVCGAYLVTVGGGPIVIVGGAAMIAALTYVGGPWPYGYRGLGDLVCLVFFGPVPVTTLDYLHAGRVTPAALAASIAVGCWATAILVVNNVRDREQDRASGKRTLAVLIGDRAARAQWLGLVAVAYALPVCGAALGLWTWGALLALASLPFALGLADRIRRARGRALNPVLRDTARLHLLFAALFSAGILIRL